jgi:two-component system nitrogen regulation response regulator NtrX
MGVQTQAKVLRVLQDQSFMRVGGSKRIEVDVRIVAATNKDLEEEIKSNRFRQDLYFRLNVVPITIPPLRERQEDLPLLTAFFSRQFAESYGRAPLIFPEETMRLLQAHPWPGNVRELKNLVERLFIVCGSKEVQPEDLPVEFSGLPTPEPLLRAFESLREAKEHFEKNYLEFMLQRHGYNVTRTAEALQIERSHLHKKIKRFGLEAKSMGSSP